MAAKTTTTTQKSEAESSVSLLYHFEKRFEKHEEMIRAHFEAYEKALTVALAANEKRLDGLNELRGTMEDKDKLYATKADVDSVKTVMSMEFDRFREAIGSLKESRAELAGKADQKQVNRVMIVSVIGMFISMVGLFMGVVTLILRLSGS